ncbi:hypothetical protein ACQ86E_07660 [Bradyrhizobium betae]|uniref:hypothetical protein n=1 Tax=Bradyrhizobium betae TaxID=244734 RepID=UPI003D664AFA
MMFVLLLIESSRRQQWPQLSGIVKPLEIADLRHQPLGLAPPCTIAVRSRVFVGMLSFSVSFSGMQIAVNL